MSNGLSIKDLADDADCEWAGDYAFAPTYVPLGLAWHFSYAEGFFLGLAAPDKKIPFTLTAPSGAILAQDWYKQGLRELCEEAKDDERN